MQDVEKTLSKVKLKDSHLISVEQIFPQCFPDYHQLFQLPTKFSLKLPFNYLAYARDVEKGGALQARAPQILQL